MTNVDEMDVNRKNSFLKKEFYFPNQKKLKKILTIIKWL